MIEDSVDNFILNYKTYAAEIEILPKIEGSTLVEAIALNKVFHFFERTGPYDSKPGKARAILNLMIKEIHSNAIKVKALKVTGISELKVEGLVLEREQKSIILDVGIPLVVTNFKDIPDEIAAGEWIGVSSLAPIHGFVLPEIIAKPQY